MPPLRIQRHPMELCGPLGLNHISDQIRSSPNLFQGPSLTFLLYLVRQEGPLWCVTGSAKVPVGAGPVPLCLPVQTLITTSHKQRMPSLSKEQNQRCCCTHKQSTLSACSLLPPPRHCALNRGPFPPSVCPHGLGLDKSLQEASPFTSTQLPPEKRRWLGTITKGSC